MMNLSKAMTIRNKNDHKRPFRPFANSNIYRYMHNGGVHGCIERKPVNVRHTRHVIEISRFSVGARSFAVVCKEDRVWDLTV
jgi:hypothetical protein